MDDIHLLSTSASTILKPACSTITNSLINNRSRTDSTSVIQQSDVSSSRPALLAHDALGPLLFEALDGFFFTINNNYKFDCVSDNVGQYLKFSQEELAGQTLHHCVHPSDVGEFLKAWGRTDAGDSQTSNGNIEQQNGQSRGHTFLCRMKINDESTTYTTMAVSVALHGDTSDSDKTFLICIARRPPVNDYKDKPHLLGFNQFSSRINLDYNIESLDSSNMKCEKIDMNYNGKQFQDYVHTLDIPLIERHFQEVIEKGESKSPIYRFRLHDDVYAFVNSQSKLFPNVIIGKSESIISTHTIVRLLDNINDLNGNPSTRLMKSVLSSNRDLHKNKQQQCTTNKPMTTPSQTSTTPIGTHFAMTMLGMHKNSSDSLQQHMSSTLGTLIRVQNSLSTSNTNDRAQPPSNIPPSTKPNSQKSTTFETVTSSDTVEFGSKRTSFSPSLSSVPSNHGSASPPANSFDTLFPSSSPANDFNSLLTSYSPGTKKLSSPLQLADQTSLFSNNDIYTTVTSPLTNQSNLSIQSTNHLRSSTRLRQLLATKSPPSSTSSPRGYNDNKSHMNTLDEFGQVAESPTTTHVSPSSNDLPSPTKRNRNPSQTNGPFNNTNTSADVLLKTLLGRNTSLNTMLSGKHQIDLPVQDNNMQWPSPGSVPPIKTESIHSDDSSSGGGSATNGTNVSNKLRSDTFLRTLLNDEVRPQKVFVEAPFSYNSRHKSNQRSLENTNPSAGSNNQNRAPLKSQLSLQAINSSDITWENKEGKKKQRQHSHSFSSRNNPVNKISPIRKPGRPKREISTSDYLLSNPQSTLSDNSLDSLFDTSANIEQPVVNHSSPTSIRRTPRQLTGTNTTTTANLKRSFEGDEQIQNSRKHPKLTQALTDNVKIECQENLIISPSIALAATRPLNQPSQPIIKMEPDIFDHNMTFDQISSPSLNRHSNNSTSANSQSTLLHSLIRGTQTLPQGTNKDAPLYDLLQNIDGNSTSMFSTVNTSSPSTIMNNDNIKIDSLDPYHITLSTQSSSSQNNSTVKDDYLAALLSSDPQQPNEIAFVPTTKPQTPNLNRSASASRDSSRIAAIANDLFSSTPPLAQTSLPLTTQTSTPLTTNTTVNNSNDDILSYLDNKDFIDCFGDQTTIDSILKTNSANVLEPPLLTTTPKRSEKDEKAISEIYKTLVTSFNPGPSSLNSPVDNSAFSSITSDFFFNDNSTISVAPPNRTISADQSMSMYRKQQQQPPATYSYPISRPTLPSNPSQYNPECLSMEMLDNNVFPPNVSLSSMDSSYVPAQVHTDTKPMMYSPQTPTHIQHHQQQNTTQNLYYRQPSQPPQANIYNNNYAQTTLSPNQMTSYYSSAQRMTPPNHMAQLHKRPTLSHQQRPPMPQAQMHMPMNAPVPHMSPNQPHRPLMNTYSEPMMANTNNNNNNNNNNNININNTNNPPLQSDYHNFPPSLPNNNSLDLTYNHDMFMTSPASGPIQPQQQQLPQNCRMNVMQPQQQLAMHRSYSNMNLVPPTNIQQSSHASNNLMNPAMPNLSVVECRQSEDLNNQMMDCLSFQPNRSVRDYVRKQLQNTINGRQKPVAAPDMSAMARQKIMNSPNLDSNQKGEYFRNQLMSQMSTPSLQNNMRSQQQQQPLATPPSKTTL